jgi:predicted nucleic acid-binding protein
VTLDVNGFDADVLIYTATAGHPLGRRVKALFPTGPDDVEVPKTGVGSLLLLPELLSKPTRTGDDRQLDSLISLLRQLNLRPVDVAIAELAVTLGAQYRLRAADAVHLATAVGAGADRFITNNTKHFKQSIVEIDVTYPLDLPDPG